jgi:hypothetical protein
MTTETRRARWGRRRWFAAAFAAAVLALTGSSVYAQLSAVATSTSSVTTGTLKLVLAADGTSAGLPETINNMAPGDVYNVYVNLDNTGTLASAAGMTLGAAASPSNVLTTDATRGLALTITQCSVAWSGSGTCSGSTTSILASTPLASFGSPVSLSNVPALAASTGALAHLQFSLALPSASETTTNGTLPANTIQGLSTTVTWTFTETQRAATTTNA